MAERTDQEKWFVVMQGICGGDGLHQFRLRALFGETTVPFVRRRAGVRAAVELAILVSIVISNNALRRRCRYARAG
jgi:hypothetical protein